MADGDSGQKPLSVQLEHPDGVKALEYYNRVIEWRRGNSKESPAVISKLCDDAIKLFGTSNQEKRIELDQIKKQVEGQLERDRPPEGVADATKRTEKWLFGIVFRRIPAKLRAPTVVLIAVIGTTAGLWGRIPRPYWFHFSAGCSLPFNGLYNKAIDDNCGKAGKGDGPAQQAENNSKNNFCAEGGYPAQSITYEQLLNLQADSSTIPKFLAQRSILKAMPGGLGEGRYVSYVAFVKDARYSDVTKGEPANCNVAGNDANDIHIVLMPSSTDSNECHSTIAEISPHSRPPSWTPDTIKPASAGHPVRIQGQLFYDGSGTVCQGDSGPYPERASVWEIHPVYSFEVCKRSTIPECQKATQDQWTPLECVFVSGRCP